MLLLSMLTSPHLHLQPRFYSGQVTQHKTVKWAILIWSKIEMFGFWQRDLKPIVTIATTIWVSFCFLPDVHYWCKV